MSSDSNRRPTAGAKVRRALFAITLAGSAAFAVPTVFSPTHVAASKGTAYYLSLGDSLSQGVQPNRLGVSTKTNHGYVDDLFAQERVSIPGLTMKKLGCPGETSTTMISGGICTYPLGSQLAQAVEFLTTHTNVKFITLDIGANDIDGCVTGLTVDPTCITAGLTALGGNLPVILTELETAAPGVPIYAMNYYDPFLAAWLVGAPGQVLATQSVALAATFNGELASIYGAFSVPVADVSTAFDTTNFTLDPNNGLPVNVTNVCHDTWMCYPPPRGNNIHANDNGYVLIADTFGALIGNL